MKITITEAHGIHNADLTDEWAQRFLHDVRPAPKVAVVVEKKRITRGWAS